MSVTPHHLWPILLLAALAGCATAPTPVAVAPPVAPIAVTCQMNQMSEAPCVAIARQRCPDPVVDTIQLVLAHPVTTGVEQHAKTVYDYRATYACPSQGMATAL